LLQKLVSPEIEQAETRYGPMHYCADDQFVGHALRVYGEYSDGESRLWRKIVLLGDRVVDVGANIGALTLPLGQMVGPAGSVIAFEPQPENNALLRLNVGDNMTFSVYECALGETPGTTRIPRLGDLGHQNYGRVTTDSGDHVVEVRTLDSFNLESVRLIKIDVEGAESAVLRGAADTIRRCRPVLYVENDRKEKSDELVRLIQSYGYRMYHHLPLLWEEPNFRGVPVVDRGIISINLLCVPTEQVDKMERDGVMEGLSMMVPPTPQAKGKTGWAGIVRLGGIGDNLIAASVLKQLKAQGYKVDVISQEPQSCVFQNNPYVDKLTIKDGARDIPQDPWEWQKYWRGRSREYDRFANLSHSCEALLAQYKAATAYWWRAEFRRQQCGRSYLESVCDIVGVPYEFGSLFFPTEDERADALRMKGKITKKHRKVIGWVLTGTRVDKIYPMATMAVARMNKELDAAVVLFGAPVPALDYQLAREILAHVVRQNGSESGLHLAVNDDAVKKWDIRMLLTMAGVCDLVIGPDTGPMWGVAMEPMPKIVLLSHASPENITKHWTNTVTLHADQEKVPCWPCHLLHDEVATCREMQLEAGLNPTAEDRGAACISSISVEDIVETAEKLLQ
jgi:FkbM family methyltransferase